MSLHRKASIPTPNNTPVSAGNRDIEELLLMLGLLNYQATPLDLTAMLYINTPSLEDTPPLAPSDLPHAFLRRLWLYSPLARNPSYHVGTDASGLGEDSQCPVNPLDLITAVYMSTNSFLRQEITDHMVQCNFAVPLFLPPVWPAVNGTVLLCPFRGVLGQWRSHSNVQMKNMASSRMPMLSCVRLGPCNVSKSRVLNHILGGECFLHRDMPGSQLPRRLSDGLVEVGWNLPPGDHHGDVSSQPVLMANLRGDAATYEKQLSLLSHSSAVLVVFCGNFGKKEHRLLTSWRGDACHMILIDCSQGLEECEKERNGVLLRRIAKDLELVDGSVLHGCSGNEEELANRLSAALRQLIPTLHAGNLVGTASVASELNLTVDEDAISRMAYAEVEEVILGIEEGTTKYREEQLPLQGRLWKRLAYLEKEESRQKDTLASNRQQLNQELQREKESLLEELHSYKLTAAMKAFIEALCTFDIVKRAYFINWMRVKLEVMQLEQLCPTTEEPSQDLCLGLEHFLREMGLVYERYFLSPNYDLYEMFRLPSLAADLLLYGVPLEIYDGDASMVPLNWVYSVLCEVYRQLPQNSRMRVLTTLGFKDSRNAELLSALFGVNFPKGGRRHIKGAYMLLLTLPDNLREDIECELLLLIDTVGVNLPELRQQEDSLLHDNELATFVTGLSDVTLLNLPPDGQSDMQNTLHVAVSSLLRTKETGKMPICQLVTEGGGMDTKLLSCVTQILDKKTPDVLALEKPLNSDAESNSHCLVGPWNDSTSLVQPVYSNAALGLKQSLVAAFHRHAMETQAGGVGEFLENMCKVWEKVKCEDFSTEFRSTDQADALCGMCAKLVKSEQIFQDHINVWVQGVDERISALQVSAQQSGINHVESEDLLTGLKEQAAMEMKLESDKIRSSLWEHLRQEDIDVTLMETYKASLFNRLHMVQGQMTSDMNEKLESATVRRELTEKLKALLTAVEAALEVKLRTLLESSKTSDTLLEDKQQEEEFASVWNRVASNVGPRPLETEEITARMIEKLRENLTIRGMKKTKIQFKDDVDTFTVTDGHFALRSKMTRTLKQNKVEAQRFASSVIGECNVNVSERLRHKEDYSDSYTTDLLGIVDKSLEHFKVKPFEMSPRFEVDLKVYICNKARHSFQEMHEILTKDREKKERFLNETKERHLLDFLYQFRKRDQCYKAARAFTSLCLKPAALDFIYSSLERHLLEDILKSDSVQGYGSPQEFHYTLLKELMLKDSFEGFFEFLQSNVIFSRKRIEDIVMGHLSGSLIMEDQRLQHMKQILDRMKKAIVQASEGWSGIQSDTRLLLQKVCDNLESPGDVTVLRDALQGPLFEITTHREHFATCLRESVAEMSRSLAQEFNENSDIIKVPDNLRYKLQDMLYDRVKGCENQCPFCKAPCDVGEREHTVHRALMHRPKGLVSYTYANSVSLSHNTCPADIAGENQFLNKDTNGQSVPYRDYRSIYPNWSIPPEDPGSDKDSAYWRYVLMKHNSRFAHEYQCEPALLAEAWGKISQEEALANLRAVFNMDSF